MNEEKTQKGGANTILVVLLVIAAFLIGSLWTRVQNQEKTAGTANTPPAQVTTTANNNPPAQPTPDLSKIPSVTAKDHVRGYANAQIALVEYSDFECPFCKRFDPVIKQLVDDYKGKVKWVYRNYPLPFHQNAEMDAEAAECVAEAGGNDAFWKYADTLYEKTTSTGTSFTKEQLVSMASEQGNDIQSCLDSGKMKQLVQSQMTGGQNGGIQGTPGTVIINLKTGKRDLIGGALPLEQAKAQIDGVMK